MNSIAKLPPKVLEALHGWLCDSAVSLHEAVRRLNALLAERGLKEQVGRGAVYRYDQWMRREGRLPRRERRVGGMSSIFRLPSEVREAVDGWLSDPDVPRTEVTRRLNALLAERGLEQRVSLDTVYRYAWRIEREWPGPRREHRMGRMSSILRLPSEVRETLDGWLRDPAVTWKEAARRTNALLAERGLEQRVRLDTVYCYARRVVRERPSPGPIGIITRFPPEVREAVDGWLRDSAVTWKEAARRTNALLAERGLEQRVSPDAVYRYDLQMRRKARAPRREHRTDRRGAIFRLPPEVREALDGWLSDPALSLKEAARRVNVMLAERGLEQQVTCTAVNRYDLKMRDRSQRLEESREVVEAWVAELGAAPEGSLGRLVIEMVRLLSFEIALELNEGEMPRQPLPNLIKSAGQLALMVERLERASIIHQNREEKIHRLERERAAEAAARAPSEPRGLSRETIDTIKREILGIRVEE